MNILIKLTVLLLGLAMVPGAANAVEPQWPGHVPGRTYIGLHGSTDLTGPVEVNRTYYQWGDDAREDRQIKADHAAGRLPWVSFKPPGSLRSILNGDHDAAIRAKGRRYASYGKPVITTFFHEPVGDVGARQWNRTYQYIRRVMGPIGKTTYAPILNGYLWADWYSGQKGAVSDWVPPQLVTTSPLFGVDTYGEPHEINRMLDYLRARGVTSVGIAEFGREQGAAVFRQKLNLFRERAGLVSVVAYFNSRIQVFEPGSQELQDFKDYLATSVDAP